VAGNLFKSIWKTNWQWANVADFRTSQLIANLPIGNCLLFIAIDFAAKASVQPGG